MMAQRQYERVSVFREGTMHDMHPSDLSSTRSSHNSVNSLGKTPSSPNFKEPKYNYKPLILRSFSLISLLVVTLALIGVLEYAVARLPHTSTPPAPSISSNARRDMNSIYLRNANATSISSSSIATSTSSAVTSTSSPTPSSSTPSVSSTLSPVAASTAQTAYQNQDTTQLTLSSSTEPPTSSTTVTEADSSLVSTAYVPDQTTATADPATTSSPQATSTVNDAPSETWGLLLSSTAYLPSAETQSATNRFVHPACETCNPVLTTTSSAYVPASTSTDLPSSGTGDSNGNGGNSGNSGTSRNSTSLADSSENDGKKHVPFRIFDPATAFVGTYLAVLVAVVYRILWTAVYNSFNLIDPFWQLMQPGGARADVAFFSFYQTQSNLLGPIPALLQRRWTLALVALTYLVACLMPALASESIWVDTNYDCVNADLSNTNNPCFPRITANVEVLRALQGLLAFAAAVILFMATLLLLRTSGLPANPRSIATVGSLMRCPGLLEDLNEIPVDATPKEMQSALAGKRYRIGTWQCTNGETGYGIRRVAGHDGDADATVAAGGKHGYSPVQGSFAYSGFRGSPTSRFRIMDTILVFVLLGTLGVIIAWYTDGQDDGFNKFFGSSTFGPRFILTLAGTVIASLWKSTEQSSVVMAPYIRMHKRPSSPNSSILFNATSTPLISTAKTLRHGYFFTASITGIALLADALNIVIAGVPYATGETWLQFLASTYMSIAILGFSLIVAVVVVISRFWEPRVPRKPDTLGAAMSYMCGSRMLDDFSGMEYLTEGTRDRTIRGMAKRYEFRETMRKDGKLAWTVDESRDGPMYHT